MTGLSLRRWEAGNLKGISQIDQRFGWWRQLIFRAIPSVISRVLFSSFSPRTHRRISYIFILHYVSKLIPMLDSITELGHVSIIASVCELYMYSLHIFPYFSLDYFIIFQRGCAERIFRNRTNILCQLYFPNVTQVLFI